MGTTFADTRRRVERAMELIAQNPGVRPYRLRTMLMTEFSIGPKPATNALRKAREELSRTRGESLAALQDTFTDLFAQAWAEPKNRAALLRTLAILPVPVDTGKADQTPDAIVFEQVTQEQTVEALPDDHH